MKSLHKLPLRTITVKDLKDLPEQTQLKIRIVQDDNERIVPIKDFDIQDNAIVLSYVRNLNIKEEIHSLFEKAVLEGNDIIYVCKQVLALGITLEEIEQSMNKEIFTHMKETIKNYNLQ